MGSLGLLYRIGVEWDRFLLFSLFFFLDLQFVLIAFLLSFTRFKFVDLV